MTQPTDPFGDPGAGTIPDRGDPFGDPSGSFGRDRERGDAEERALVPRDQWDRYRLPHLDGTKPAANKGFTRVSTQKSALSNTFGIQEWQKRKVIDGVGKDPEIVAAAIRVQAMPEGMEREQALAKIAERAFVTGGGKERSGLGTEFHEVTEKINRGEMTIQDAPERLHRDLNAYYRLLSDHGVKILPQYLERQVLCPFNVAGTFDNIVRYWNETTGEWELLIADLKTGRSLDLAWLEILIQLWNYANAYALWVTKGITQAIEPDKNGVYKITDIEGYYEPMPPELRQDKGLIFHVPLDGSATLYVLDLSGVRTYVEAAVVAKRANAEAKLKVTTAGVFRPEAFVAPTFGVTASLQDNPAQAVQQILNPPATITAEADPTEHIVLNRAPVPEAITQGFQAQAEFFGDVQVRPGGSTTTEVDPSGLDPHNYPTKDAFTQAAKAAERLAAVADKLNAGEQVPGVIACGPPEKDPVTGRKRRTCGYCHKPGHTQKNCPENPASDKYVKPVLTAVPEPLPEETAYPVGSAETEPASMVISPEGPPQDDRPPWLDQDKAPYCLKQHPDACQWTAAGNQWVCSISGKPGQVAWQKQQTTVTAEHPHYGRPDTELGPADRAVIAETTARTLAEAAPAWETPPDMVAWGITQAQTWQALLKHREECQAAGTWNADYEKQGAERYRVLTTL